jgi:enamine deaminase RidA (YjgF/YER057c/UK114 family)
MEHSMSTQFIRRPKGLGEPLGRYSHVAVASGELVIVAGQTGIDEDGVVAAGLAAQTRQAFHNLGRALEAAGVGYQDVIKTSTFLVGPDSIPEFMEARKSVFADIYPSGTYPPNTLLVVTRLVEEALLVEVEAIAVRDRTT